MKYKTKKLIRGSITLMMVIILLPMMTLSALVVDTSRINMARSMVSSAGDLAMNSALANYDTILKDVYGLFAMSQTTGEGAKETPEVFQQRIQKYFEETLVSYGVVDKANSKDYVKQLIGEFESLWNSASDDKVSNFLDMKIDPTFTINKVSSSSLADPDILKSQIVEYMKFRAPVGFGLSLLDSIKSFTKVQDQTAVVEKQVIAQESTQDVTQACSDAIKEIRAYDDLVKSIDEGDKAVKGLDRHDDGLAVKVGGYLTGNINVPGYKEQLEKYKETWQPNYKHINKLNLMFTQKTPSTGSLALQAYDDPVRNPFVYQENSKYTLRLSNSGISANVSVANSYSGTKNDFDKQIELLSNSGTYGKTAQTYYNLNGGGGKGYLPVGVGGYIDENNKNFTNEQKAVEAFVTYEKFVAAQGTVPVSTEQVKAALVELANLKKRYDAYIGEIDKLIKEEQDKKTAAQKAKSEAEGKRDEAQGKVNSATSDKNNAQNAINTANNNIATYEGYIRSYKTNLTNLASTYKSNYSSSNETTKKEYDFTGILNSSLSSQIKSFANNNYGNGTNAIGSNPEQLIKDIISYLNGNQGSLSDNEKSIFNKVTKYKNSTTREFKFSFGAYSSYLSNISDAVGSSLKTEPLYHALDFLYRTAITIRLANYYVNTKIPAEKETITEKNKAKNNADSIIAEQQEIVDAQQTIVDAEQGKIKAAQDKINAYNLDKETAYSKYAERLQYYQTNLCTPYQRDFKSYKRYIATAKSVMWTEASRVKNQFNSILNNVKLIKEELELVNQKLVAVDKAISTYLENVKNWENQKNTYVSENGSDSFSSQSSSDISATKTEYDQKSLKNLIDYSQVMLDEFTNFYNYINDGKNFTYGGRNIRSMNDVKHLTEAGEKVKNGLPNIVTENDANGKFDELYAKTNVPELHLENGYYFLNPVLNLQFLKYLNQTFPKDESKPSKVSESSGQSDSEVKKQYESMKKGLSDDSGKDTKDEGSGNFGYTYKKKKVGVSKLPSGTANEVEKTSSVKLNTGGDKVDASSGLSANNSLLSTVLSGLGNLGNNLLQNAYVLDYIFENFSYNTIIQDNIVKGEKLDDSSKDLGNMLAAIAKVNSNAEKYKDSAKMLSTWGINEKNNALHGAEIEYILYGSNDADANVLYAKGSIYAIRFAFDCIYAFTDTEIRNISRAAGLAVQAATLGIVPYQIVQIVMQLAFAAGEAALDLQMISSGLDVAVVKSKETWLLSLTGLTKNAAAGALEAATGAVADGAANLAKKGIESIASGIQGVIDSGVDELAGSIKKLQNDLVSGVEHRAEDIANQACTIVQNKVEEALNKIQFYDYRDKAQADAQSYVDQCFGDVYSAIDNLGSQFAGNQVADKVLGVIKTPLKNKVTEIRDSVTDTINTGYANSDVGSAIAENMNSIKKQMLDGVNGFLDQWSGQINQAVDGMADSVKGELNNFITEAEEASAEKVEEIKKGVSEKTNEFINNKLGGGDGTSTMGQGLDETPIDSTGSSGKSVASMIKFGYKEYLMLFVFIGLNIDASARKILVRTADIIQKNVARSASKDAKSEYHHKCAEFKMRDAMTYVEIKGNVKLEMLFIDMDFFSRVFRGGNTDVDFDPSPASTLKYTGFLGY